MASSQDDAILAYVAQRRFWREQQFQLDQLTAELVAASRSAIDRSRDLLQQTGGQLEPCTNATGAMTKSGPPRGEP